MGEKAVKNDNGKPMLALIPPNAEWEVAKAFTVGMEEYGKFNYMNGLEYMRLMSAVRRHINKDLKGEVFDEKYKENYHLAHAIAGLMMILETRINGNLIDDRYYK